MLWLDSWLLSLSCHRWPLHALVSDQWRHVGGSVFAQVRILLAADHRVNGENVFPPCSELEN